VTSSTISTPTPPTAPSVTDAGEGPSAHGAGLLVAVAYGRRREGFPIRSGITCARSVSDTMQS
jgi:hypothetical protein